TKNKGYRKQGKDGDLYVYSQINEPIYLYYKQDSEIDDLLSFLVSEQIISDKEVKNIKDPKVKFSVPNFSSVYEILDPFNLLLKQYQYFTSILSWSKDKEIDDLNDHIF